MGKLSIFYHHVLLYNIISAYVLLSPKDNPAKLPPSSLKD